MFSPVQALINCVIEPKSHVRIDQMKCPVEAVDPLIVLRSNEVFEFKLNLPSPRSSNVSKARETFVERSVSSSTIRRPGNSRGANLYIR